MRSENIGTVTISAAAPAAGLTINLTSDNAAATLPNPATATVAAGQTSATFPVTTTAVTTTQTATITATYNNVVKTAAVTINPAPPVTIELQSLTLNPTSVFGSKTSAGTVMLSAAAPAEGVSVSLTSSNPQVAAVPATVTMTQGQIGYNFNINTAAVSAATDVTITAESGGVTKTAVLRVLPRFAITNINNGDVLSKMFRLRRAFTTWP